MALSWAGKHFVCYFGFPCVAGFVGIRPMTAFLLKLKRQNRLRLIRRSLLICFFGIIILLVTSFALETAIWVFASEQHWCFERGVCP